MAIQLNGSEYLTANEVASLVGVSRQTLWRWQQEGGAPKGLRYRGKHLLFSQEEVGLFRARAERVTPKDGNSAREIYLDNNSSTRPTAEVREAVSRAMHEQFGNPSSAHRRGRIARDRLEEAREAVAQLCGAGAESTTFTSGGSEANSAVVLSPLMGMNPKISRVVTTQIEHSSVLACCRVLERAGVEVVFVPVGQGGIVRMDRLQEIELDDETLVTIHWVNNETGTIQPIEEIGRLCRTRGSLFHTDGAQAVGKIPVEMKRLPVDYLTLTAHKFHGPQGVGAVVSNGPRPLARLIMSGDQEFGRRGGTENLPGICGLGVAARNRFAGLRQAISHCRSQRDFIEKKLLELHPGSFVNGDKQNRVSNTTNICFHGVDGQALMASLDAKGICVSQSSACTNMRPEPSHVLTALGLDEDDAYASIRVSVSEDTDVEDVVAAVDAFEASLGSLGVLDRLGAGRDV